MYRHMFIDIIIMYMRERERERERESERSVLNITRLLILLQGGMRIM